MLKTLRLIPAFLLLATVGYAQQNKADSLYQKKNYNLAAKYYLNNAAESDFSVAQNASYYRAALCYAQTGKADSAFLLLKKAVANGYDNANELKKDTAFSSLHAIPEWNKLVLSIKPRALALTGNPDKVKLITSDIHNFWKAYDLAKKDTANRLQIFRKYYIEPGSPAMQDYFAAKVKTMKGFIGSQDRKPKFYAAIRSNTYLVDAQKPVMLAAFKKFKNLYPDAVFPDVTFVIGSFSSGGTSSAAGLLIGLDQSAISAEIPLEELSLRQRNNMGQIKGVPYVIVHELIHFNQQGMAPDTTLLRAAIVEGMADFIAELTTGVNPNARLHVWAKGKEQRVWADFKKEMYLDRDYNWIANGKQETAEKPADLGYWVGYYICKGYYDKSADKKQAIYDMLNIKDYKAFYQKSGAGE